MSAPSTVASSVQDERRSVGGALTAISLAVVLFVVFTVLTTQVKVVRAGSPGRTALRRRRQLD